MFKEVINRFDFRVTGGSGQAFNTAEVTSLPRTTAILNQHYAASPNAHGIAKPFPGCKKKMKFEGELILVFFFSFSFFPFS